MGPARAQDRRLPKMRLALFQPDIPQNVGAAIRLAACFETPLDIIEPCGFALTERGVRRAAMDYAALACIERHASWAAFAAAPERAQGRLVLLSAHGETVLWDFAFAAGDTLLMGRESAGVTEEVRAAADIALRIPIARRARTLNVAAAAAIALAEMVRQRDLSTAAKAAP